MQSRKSVLKLSPMRAHFLSFLTYRVPPLQFLLPLPFSAPCLARAARLDQRRRGPHQQTSGFEALSVLAEQRAGFCVRPAAAAGSRTLLLFSAWSDRKITCWASLDGPLLQARCVGNFLNSSDCTYLFRDHNLLRKGNTSSKRWDIFWESEVSCTKSGPSSRCALI